MEGHDGDTPIRVAEFHMASSLTDLDESRLDESSDYVCTSEDRQSRAHADRRKVAMIGGSSSSGRTSSSK